MSGVSWIIVTQTPEAGNSGVVGHLTELKGFSVGIPEFKYEIILLVSYFYCGNIHFLMRKLQLKPTNDVIYG
jgi:hypothetical protein